MGRDLVAEGIIPPPQAQGRDLVAEGIIPAPQSNTGIATPSFDGSPIVEKALQGATLGFSDELQSAGRAAVDKVGGLISGEDVDFTERYNQYQNDYKTFFDQYDEQNPVLGTVAEVAGSIPTAGGIAAKVVSKVPHTASKFSNFLGKSAALSATGATEAGLYSAGKAQPGERLDAAAQGAKVGAIAAPIVGVTAGAISNRLASNKIGKIVGDNAPTRESLRETANATYRELDDLGVTVSADAYSDLVNRLRVQAKNAGARSYNSPQVEGVLKEMEALAGKNVSLNDIDLLRQAMGTAAGSLEPKQRRVASIMINSIDDAIDNLTPGKVVAGNGEKAGELYSKARNLWARSRKSELLEEAVGKAKQTASGFENGLRIEFRRILNNKKKIRGFTQDEIKAMRKVVRGSATGNIAKLLGKLGIKEGSATSMVGASVGAYGGHSIGGPIGAVAVPLAGQAAKILSSKITQKHARLAQEMVRAGKNSKAIIDAYVRNVKEKNPQDLAALLIDNKADIPKLEKAIERLMGPKRKLATDALALITAGGVAVNQD